MDNMEHELICMLADYLRITPAQAASRYSNSSICVTLNDEHANLRFQPVEYVFTLLKQEIAEEDEDDYDDDFERQETMPEGHFVRSH